MLGGLILGQWIHGEFGVNPSDAVATVILFGAVLAVLGLGFSFAARPVRLWVGLASLILIFVWISYLWERMGRTGAINPVF